MQNDKIWRGNVSEEELFLGVCHAPYQGGGVLALPQFRVFSIYAYIMSARVLGPLVSEKEWTNESI